MTTLSLVILLFLNVTCVFLAIMTYLLMNMLYQDKDW